MAKRDAQLFCQHLENISGKALEEYSKIIKDLFGRRHGIYALYRRDKVYYVGLARNLRGRLKHHLRDRHRGKWDRFSIYLTLSPVHLKEFEALILRISKPRGNKVKGKFVRSADMHRFFKRMLRQEMDAKLQDVLGEGASLRESKGGRKDRHGTSLAPYVDRSMRIRLRYKGKTYWARVRKDGLIRMGKMLFRSPSAAGKIIRQRATNGWWWWEYERAPGEWVRLRELRR